MAEMKNDIRFDEAKGIIYGRVVGAAGQEPMIEFYLKINAMVVEKRCKFIIVDFRKRKRRFGSGKAFYLTEKVAEAGVDRAVYGAIVDDKDEAEYRFAEDLAKNRGWMELKYFPFVSSGQNADGGRHGRQGREKHAADQGQGDRGAEFRVAGPNKKGVKAESDGSGGAQDQGEHRAGGLGRRDLPYPPQGQKYDGQMDRHEQPRSAGQAKELPFLPVGRIHFVNQQKSDVGRVGPE